MLVVLRPVEHFNATRRLLIIVPPLVENVSGLEAPMTSVKQLAAQLSVPVAVYGVKQSIERILPYMDSIQPSARIESKSLEKWEELIPVLDAERKEGDMIGIFSARPGQIAWRPALNRLPQVLITHFPKTSLALFYAPTYIEHDYKNLFLSRNLLNLFTEETTYFTKKGISLDTCLEELLLRRFSTEKSEKIKAHLSRGQYEALVELRPGIILLHSHTEEVNMPVILMGASTGGIDAERLRAPAHTVFILLSPAVMPPEEHLKLLALIASFLQPDEIAEALKTSSSLPDLRKKIATQG
jgi:mannitol/fructose-specific phosphotransferase system IIA component (Ntr-type)